RAPRAEPAYRKSLDNNDAAVAAEDRPKADRADGRRHQQDRRSVGQGHEPQPARRRPDRRQYRLDPHRVRALPRFWGGCDHGEQRGLAPPAAFHTPPPPRPTPPSPPPNPDPPPPP